MTAKYKLTRNPNPNPQNDPSCLPFHPRLISCGTIHTNELIEAAKERSSFSPADMKGVLQLLQDVMADYLMAGFQVDLDGMGIFSVSLKGKSVIQSEKIRSESILFKGVNFRASKSLKERLKTMTVTKDEQKVNDRTYYEPEECKQLILHHLESSPFVTQKEYAQLCKCSNSKASIDLRKLVKEGRLYRKRLGTMYLYFKEKEITNEPKFSEIIH